MNAKTAEQVYHTYQRLVALDQEIISLEKLANKILDSGDDLTITIPHPKDKTPTKSMDVDMESIMERMMSYSSMWGTTTSSETKHQQQHVELKDYEALQVVGCILQMRQQERKSLMLYLESVK